MKKFAGMSYVRQKNGRFFDFKNLLHVWICYFKLCELLGILLLSNTGTQIIYKCHKANAIKSGQAALTYIGAKMTLPPAQYTRWTYKEYQSKIGEEVVEWTGLTKEHHGHPSVIK